MVNLGEQMIYKTGDVTKATETGLKFLPHIVNCYGVAGSGVVCAIEKMERNPIQQYRNWYKQRYYEQQIFGTDVVRDIHFELGEVQFVESGEFIVCNMVAQKWQEEVNCKQVPAIRLWALQECMERVAEQIKLLDNFSCLVCPKFGSMRAGANWDRDIVPLIENIWKDFDIIIYEY